jgi:hypothetical protein
MVAELSLLARIGRRLTGKAPLDPGDADAWRAALRELSDAVTLSCWSVTAARATRAASANDSMDGLRAEAKGYIDQTEHLVPLVNHDRQTAVLLGQSRRRAEQLRDRAEFWSRSTVIDSPADHVMWLEHRLIDSAFLALAAEQYVDHFLLPAPRRAFTAVGARKVLRHGEHVSDQVFSRAVRTVHTTLATTEMEIRLELPASSNEFRVALEPADVVRLSQFERAKGAQLSAEVAALVQSQPLSAMPWS